MKGRLIVTIVTNLIYEVAIVFGMAWLLPQWGIHPAVWAILLCVVIFAIYAVICFEIGNRTLQKKIAPGSTDMTGMEGIVTQQLDPKGMVKIEGELWAAEAENEATIEVGTAVVVTGQKELVLKVRVSP
jgi:membrane protein implicated in regulation of membrane protease activity